MPTTGASRRLSAIAVVVATFLTACPSPFADPDAQPSAPEGLAVMASEVPPRAAESPQAGDPDRSTGPDSRTESPAQGSSRGRARTADPPSASGSASSFVVIGAIGDARGDASPPGPTYADLASVSLEDDLDRTLRVSVRMAGRLPTRLGKGEVEGVGVDLALASGEYQLFASGEPGGWFGYFHTPDGFVRYPVDFSISGRELIFTVPWDALGGRGAGRASAFADHTGSRSYSEDRAPDSGAVPFGD